MESIIGLILVTLAGFGTGAAAWPFKVIKDIHFEQYLFFSMLFAIGIYPWTFILIKVPDLVELIKTVGFKPLFISNLLTLAWGVANVLYFICVIKIGAALTVAILSAIGMSVGIIMPLFFKGSGLFTNSPNLFSKPGMVILLGLLVIIIGVAFVIIAGFGREKVMENKSEQRKREQAAGNFFQGLLLVILAGVLSAGIGLAFVYGHGSITEAAKLQGVSEITANLAVWALVCVGGVIINVGYAIFWMTTKKTWNLLFVRKDEIICGALFGIQFILSILFMGRGMVLLGILGASVGFGIQQSMQLIGGQIVGFAGREWKGVNGRPRNTMYLALVVIFIAVIILAFSNTIV